MINYASNKVYKRRATPLPTVCVKKRELHAWGIVNAKRKLKLLYDAQKSYNAGGIPKGKNRTGTDTVSRLLPRVSEKGKSKTPADAISPALPLTIYHMQAKQERRSTSRPSLPTARFAPSSAVAS
jgi:hypothetical protein